MWHPFELKNSSIFYFHWIFYYYLHWLLLKVTQMLSQDSLVKI